MNIKDILRVASSFYLGWSLVFFANIDVFDWRFYAITVPYYFLLIFSE